MFLSKKISFLFLLFGLAFFTVSCDKDTMESEEESGDSLVVTGSSLGVAGLNDEDCLLDPECLAFVFPITIDVPEAGEQVLEDEDELEILLDELEELAEEDSTVVCPSLVYPITVILEDDAEELVSDEGGLVALIEACEGTEEEDEDDDDGENDEEDEDDENEEDEEEDEDDEDDEEDEEDEDCDEDEHDEECFEVVFPITVELPDGTTESVANEEAFFTLEEAVEEEFGEDLLVVFPIEIEYEDGTIEEIGSEEEYEIAEDECE